MRFLVVDDSSVDRHLLTSVLTELGHEADVCANSQGVLDKIASEDYAAVFLDIVMPEQDGYKFLRSLRANPTTAKQHVIFCSNKKTPIEINYGLKRAGADDYVVKPVNRDSVEKALEKIQP